MDKNILEILKEEAFKSQRNAEQFTAPAKYSRDVHDYEHYFGISMKKVLKNIKGKDGDDIIVLDVMCGGGKAVKELNEEYKINAFGVDINYYFDLQKSHLSTVVLMISTMMQ